MVVAYLLAISLATPNEVPKIVRGYNNVDACVADALTRDQRGVMPLYRKDKLPVLYVCTKVLFPT